MKKPTAYIFYFTVFFLLISFNFKDKIITGGWYQQNMPNLGGKEITDITFLDSLTGYAVANQPSDSTYILKTTNSGDNWSIIHRRYYPMTKIHFLNLDTGYACGGYFYKTTNGGYNWNQQNMPPISAENMFVVSKNTIWLLYTDQLTGGIFLTTNGGVSWENRSNGLLAPLPDKMYFYNSRIGFASGLNMSRLFKTSNSGLNWFSISGVNGFNDIVFVDSLTGYKTSDSIRKTTDGGVTWVVQKKPVVNNFDDSFFKFAFVNKDTIWGVGTEIWTTLGYRGILYKTTNGGVNWGYQIPDTININANNYHFVQFINKNIGWAHHVNNKGIHTTFGGNDTTFYTGIQNISQIPPKNFELKQNYPNPYNNSSLIEYYVNEPGWVKLKIYDISGKEMGTLVNEEQNTGGYGVPVSIPLSSGVYFYKMVYVNKKGEMQMDVKKMIVIK